MTKYEAWEIVNQCNGLYFTWKEKNKDDSHTFSFSGDNKRYTLTVKTKWKILYYGEAYYDSVDYNNYSNIDLLLNHAGANLKVVEVSISDNFELRFFMKGKLELVILTNQISNRAHWVSEFPEWVFKEGDKMLAQSPKQ